MSAENFPGIRQYLNKGEVASVEEWARPVLSLIERNPLLRQVNLVVEGGIGRGQTMPHVVRKLFPDALYVGMDLSRFMFSVRRYTGSVDTGTIDGIIYANQHPSIPMKGAIIRANCFDTTLVDDIAKKTDRDIPMFASWRALNAFLNEGLSAHEDKRREDETSLEDIVSPVSPFRVQLYLAEYPFEETGDEQERYLFAYRELETLAKQGGWITDKEENWLLLIRS